MTVKFTPAPNEQAMNVTFDPERRNFYGHHIANDGHKIMLVIGYGDVKPKFGESYEALRFLEAMLSTPENPLSSSFDEMPEVQFRTAISEYSSKFVQAKREYLQRIGADLESEQSKMIIAGSKQSADYVSALQDLSFEELKKLIRIQCVTIVDGGYQVSIGTCQPDTLLLAAFMPTGSDITTEQIEILRSKEPNPSECPLCAAGIDHPNDLHSNNSQSPGKTAVRPSGHTLH